MAAGRETDKKHPNRHNMSTGAGAHSRSQQCAFLVVRRMNRSRDAPFAVRGAGWLEQALRRRHRGGDTRGRYT